jgi:hypothetical protein
LIEDVTKRLTFRNRIPTLSTRLDKRRRSSQGSAIAELTREVRQISRDRISDIDLIDREAAYLAINALIEAARAKRAAVSRRSRIGRRTYRTASAS